MRAGDCVTEQASGTSLTVTPQLEALEIVIYCCSTFLIKHKVITYVLKF